jgi:hypothetical protein
MVDLIVRVRDIIGDAPGAGAVFTDEQVQGALDRHRDELRYVELAEIESIAPGGAVTYKDFRAEIAGAQITDWEADAVLYSTSYAVLTPSSSDYAAGRWSFAAGQALPVLLTGQTYDVHAAAAELLEEWATKLKLEYDFSASGDAFSRSQKVSLTLERAADERAKGRVVTVAAERTDWIGV